MTYLNFLVLAVCMAPAVAILVVDFIRHGEW